MKDIAFIPDSLRVALVSTQKKWQGGERQFELLACGLLERGHECLALVRKGSELEDKMAKMGVRTNAFSGRGLNPKALWTIRRTLTRFSPDVLYCNDSHALSAGGIASLWLDIPVRVASRRVDFPVRSKQYSVFADKVICVSRSVRKSCLAANVDSNKLHVVSDGIDPSSLKSVVNTNARRGLGISADRQLIVTIASLTECKGHRYLLEAMSRIVRNHPNAILVCAGEGPLELQLRKRVEDLGLQQNVRFVGFRSDALEIVWDADLMVVPSVSEGLCSSIIDAMFLHCPVVATRTGGIPDLLESPAGELGWMVPPRDPVALAATIEEALINTDERIVRARLASMVAHDRFTHDGMVDGTIAVFRAALESRERQSVPFRKRPHPNLESAAFSPLDG